MVIKQVSEGFLVNSKGFGKVKGFSEKEGVLLYLFERLRVSVQEYRGSGAEGFFCKNYTADRYLRTTAVGFGSDGPGQVERAGRRR